jgi:uncharacterized protein (DUF488 family)
VVFLKSGVAFEALDSRIKLLSARGIAYGAIGSTGCIRIG